MSERAKEQNGSKMAVDLVLTELSGEIIAAAIAVHRVLGPGLLESAYEHCLCHELRQRDIRFERQVDLPVVYKGHDIDCGYRLDLLVAEQVVVEIKSVAKVGPLHEAQLLTYMKLGSFPLGLLLNFNVAVLRDGILRRVL